MCGIVRGILLTANPALGGRFLMAWAVCDEIEPSSMRYYQASEHYARKEAEAQLVHRASGLCPDSMRVVGGRSSHYSCHHTSRIRYTPVMYVATIAMVHSMM